LVNVESTTRCAKAITMIEIQKRILVTNFRLATTRKRIKDALENSCHRGSSKWPSHGKINKSGTRIRPSTIAVVSPNAKGLETDFARTHSTIRSSTGLIVGFTVATSNDDQRLSYGVTGSLVCGGCDRIPRFGARGANLWIRLTQCSTNTNVAA